jgi:hypothetical protein
MATIGGPNTEKDNLVFGYDTGYGVADNNTSTRFYPGEPTTNQADTDAKRNWGTHNGATSSTTTAPEKGPGWKKLIITNINGNNYRLAQFPYLAHANGTTRTYSVEFDVGSLTGYFMFVDGTSGYAQTNVSGKGRYSTTITASGGNKSIAIFLGKSGTHSSINHVIYYKEYQVEEKSHASPFTDSTRSDTTSLIDLKKTTNIDVSNVSFDSTGQPEFDGTDDEIDITFPTLSSNLGSIEVVVARKDTTTNSFIFGAVGGSTNRYYLRHAASTSYDACRGNPLASASFGSLTEDKFYHLVMTWNANTIYAYTNGELMNTSSYTNPGTSITSGNIGQGSGNHVMADLPVFKIHSQILSATEIKNNYKAYKNRFNL